MPTTQFATEPMSLDQAMKLIDARAAWTEFPPITLPRHPAEIYLKDLTIVLDPGHGGTDGGAVDKRAGYKSGPTGVKEAYMNLRVGLLLRRLLKDAGANVIMTREGDDSIDLKERAEVANNARRPDGGVGADLFISLHHNAASQNSSANFTTVWYHGTVDEAEPDLDAARPVAHAIGDALHTQWAKTSPLMSDSLMYDGGFGVLRACKAPCFLCESSFYTNRDEEQRLRDAGYNLREAYGIYRGLCEWAYEGRPTQSSPIITTEGSQVGLAMELSEGLPEGGKPWWGSDRSRIIRSTIELTLDGIPLPFQYDEKTKLLTASLPRSGATTTPTNQIIAIHHANMFKHHNWPQRYRLNFGVSDLGGAPSIKVEALGAMRGPSTRPTKTQIPIGNQK